VTHDELLTRCASSGPEDCHPIYADRDRDYSRSRAHAVYRRDLRIALAWGRGAGPPSSVPAWVPPRSYYELVELIFAGVVAYQATCVLVEDGAALLPVPDEDESGRWVIGTNYYLARLVNDIEGRSRFKKHIFAAAITVR
jgi:hypothetical protein